MSFLISFIIFSAHDRIIERHRQQSNFQLIIITHDEDFLKMLSLTDYVDYYYRVKKDAE